MKPLIILLMTMFAFPSVGYGKKAKGRAIIVGGGIAGLTAAYKLKKKNNVLLLEKWPGVGGRVWEG